MVVVYRGIVLVCAEVIRYTSNLCSHWDAGYYSLVNADLHCVNVRAAQLISEGPPLFSLQE